MRYSNPELVDLLAAEYVLGTLQGGARSRFEKLQRDRVDIENAVLFWEQNLAVLGGIIDPVQPPKAVWREINSAIRIESRALRQSRNFWRFFSAISSSAVLVMALLLLMPVLIEEVEPTYLPQHVAIVGEQENPLWVISADLETGVLNARAMNATAAGIDKVFELWMLPEQGNPVSIGLLPVNGNRVSHTLPAGLMALLKQSRGLAISIEPPGGSPTGLPTGPVVQTATMLEL